MRNYCSVVKNKLDMFVGGMEKKVSAFVADSREILINS